MMRVLRVGVGIPAITGAEMVDAEDGAEALQMCRLYMVDALLTRLHLGDMAAYTLISRLRMRSSVPIIVYDTDGTLRSKVESLRIGADDYIVSGTDQEELEHRLRAVFRRSTGQSSSVVHIGSIVVDTQHCTVHVAGSPVHLTKSEREVLVHLIERRGRVVSRDSMMETLYSGIDEPDPKIIDVYVCKLRRKLGRHGANIETIWGRGWTISETPPPALAAVG